MKNQIIVKENKQGKKLLFNVHVHEFLCFYYSRSRTQPQSSARLGSGSSQKSSAPVWNKLPKSKKKNSFCSQVQGGSAIRPRFFTLCTTFGRMPGFEPELLQVQCSKIYMSTYRPSWRAPWPPSLAEGSCRHRRCRCSRRDWPGPPPPGRRGGGSCASCLQPNQTN